MDAAMNARQSFRTIFANARRAQRKAPTERDRMMRRLYSDDRFDAALDALYWRGSDPLELRAGTRPVVSGNRVEWRHVSRVSGKELQQ